MALVVFLKGINVGGHRTFRPSMLAERLKHLDAVNIGAAGTLVIRRPATRAKLRAMIRRLLPFDAHIMMCNGVEIRALIASCPFHGRSSRPDIIRFAGILSRLPRSTPRVPFTLPQNGRWLVNVLARQGRFLIGTHRREMKVIGCLNQLEHLFGVPVTIRSWSTIAQIAAALGEQSHG